ncbi:MAG: DUF4038 domain-containing protein, partial [Methylococcaceae bacterium]|nr:DUF4038 domain-containing protein [Methylococcaceae bacterium]
PYSGNGQLPFTKRHDGQNWTGALTYSNINNEGPDFTTPNEAYWTHVDGILAYTQSKGILCFMFPAYVGWNGLLSAGWMQHMVANGTTKMTTYGAWIANRYKNYPNIVWMLGGDMGSTPGTDRAFTAPELAVEKAMLAGMKSVSNQQSTHYSAEWSGDSIYTTISDATLKAAGTLQGAYTWNSVSTWSRNGYAATPTMPAYLLEGPYDEEGPDGTNVNENATQPCRRFQWWGWLSSIGGYMAGNGYIWPFKSGVWTGHMNTQTTLDNVRLNGFMQSIAWQTLVPSGLGGIGTLITSGGSSPAASDYVAAAADPGGALLVAYVPPAHSGNITVNMTAMSAPARARWFNPTTA